MGRATELVAGDPSARWATAAALALLVAGRWLPRRPPAAPVVVPAGPIVVLAVAAGLPTADVNPRRYVESPAWAYPWWVAVVVAAVAVAVVVAAWRWRADAVRSPLVTVVLAAAVVGAYVTVPETDLLRLGPGPLLLVGGATCLGVCRPLGPPGATGVVVAVLWLSAIDSVARPAALLGPTLALALGVIAAAWGPTVMALPRRPPAQGGTRPPGVTEAAERAPTTPGHSLLPAGTAAAGRGPMADGLWGAARRCAGPLVLIVLLVATSRLAGVGPSLAASGALAAAGAAAALTAAVGRPPRQAEPGPHR